MQKFFNTAGPCVPEDHYTLSPLRRFGNIRRLIDEKRYFLIHAPRQTGKTTAMITFCKELNKEGKYVALYVNIEAAQPLRDNVEAVNEVIIDAIRLFARFYLPPEFCPSEKILKEAVGKNAVFSVLHNWASELPKPLVVIIDEADSLIGDGLISLLRQIRAGYAQRPTGFPHSLCLVGVRDLRDYRIVASDGTIITGGSAFNIKDVSLTLRNFNEEEVRELYEMHTAETGQKFSDEALAEVFRLTQGQPWLVNALAREMCFDFDHAIPFDQNIELHHVRDAAEYLILRRDVHLDQLADKLTEPRVMPIIQRILVGENAEEPDQSSKEEMQYVVDLGLVRRGAQGWEIANPIYREVIPRELTFVMQDNLGQNPVWYKLPNGKLDIEKVLQEFIKFCRRHGEMTTRRKYYTEAAHHLLFMAWLQRIVNGGGRIEREYASGLGRLDLMIEFAGERFAFELKLATSYALEEGKEQLVGYLNRLSLERGYLLIFHRGAVENWDALGVRETVEDDGKTIDIVWL